MKKIMILAASAALVLAAGCAKNEVFTPQADGQHAIGFTNYAPKQITKADGSYASGNTLVDDKKFKVYAFKTANATAFASSLTGATLFMDGVDVTYNTGGDADATVNTYSPLRYWPSGDTPDKLTFWAYYPIQADNGIVYTAPSGSNGVGSYAFTAAATSAEMVDFMVADVKNDMYYGTTGSHPVAVNGVVPFTFKHQLTKVAFVFQTDTDDACTKVVLTGAELANIRTTGTLSTTYATGTTTTSWNDSEDTPDDYSITISGSSISASVLPLKSTPPADPTAIGGAASDIFLMVPQTLEASGGSDPQTLTLTWDVKTFDTSSNASTYGATQTTVGSNGLLSITHNSKVLYLNGDCMTTYGGATPTTFNWEKNGNVLYTITVGPKPIRFTATVTAWDDPVTNGYINVQ